MRDRRGGYHRQCYQEYTDILVNHRSEICGQICKRPVESEGPVGPILASNPSIALESYLVNVKLSISEIHITKPQHNLSHNEHKAVKELQKDTIINLKCANKGSTTVILNKRDKIQEAQVQLHNRDHYHPLENPMVTETLPKVNELIAKLRDGKHR